MSHPPHEHLGLHAQKQKHVSSFTKCSVYPGQIHLELLLCIVIDPASHAVKTLPHDKNYELFFPTHPTLATCSLYRSSVSLFPMVPWGQPKQIAFFVRISFRHVVCFKVSVTIRLSASTTLCTIVLRRYALTKRMILALMQANRCLLIDTAGM